MEPVRGLVGGESWRPPHRLVGLGGQPAGVVCFCQRCRGCRFGLRGAGRRAVVARPGCRRRGQLPARSPAG
eukprot:11180079-Lingulodinium_polyedra.AAC.1